MVPIVVPSEARCQLPHESPHEIHANSPPDSGKSPELNSSLPEPISSSTIHSCTGSSQSFVPQSANMMECHGLFGGGTSTVVVGGEEVSRVMEGGCVGKSSMQDKGSRVVEGVDVGNCFL